MSTHTNQPEGLWDSERLAAFLDLPSVRTLDQWSYRGVGPRAIKVGRFRRYDPADVYAWVEAQKRAAESRIPA
jgi:hypothetical protein